MKHTDIIIVGQGLAGTLLAFALYKAGKSFVVIDNNPEVSASRIAAGMFTPVSGKRMVKSKHADAQLALARQTYAELEQLLTVKLWHDQPVHQVYGSVKEQNDLSVKAEWADFIQHIRLQVPALPHVKEPFGGFEVNESGWVNTGLLITTFRKWLIERDAYLETIFDHSRLQIIDAQVIYDTITADQLYFCEGWKGANNPLFPEAPFNMCKGEVLTIRCVGLDKEHIIKKGIYLVHLQDDLYKVGATYSWDDLNEEPEESALQLLRAKLDALLDLPYEVVAQQAGIRPTTDLREPFFLQHPQYKQLAMLNGLGTKGVLIGPWWVKECLHV
jgi:glycine/D-amino acid oxidase-like deaminating enzyme